jgi:hypothetical protein
VDDLCIVIFLFKNKGTPFCFELFFGKFYQEIGKQGIYRVKAHVSKIHDMVFNVTIPPKSIFVSNAFCGSHGVTRLINAFITPACVTSKTV